MLNNARSMGLMLVLLVPSSAFGKDTDGDGVRDSKDACVEIGAGQYDADEDGCPDDSDGDGILDQNDRCPRKVEDMDGFQDEDGCPDPDNDGDGIPDKKDQCPVEPEIVNGYMDEDGCGDSVPGGCEAPESAWIMTREGRFVAWNMPGQFQVNVIADSVTYIGEPAILEATCSADGEVSGVSQYTFLVPTEDDVKVPSSDWSLIVPEPPAEEPPSEE